MSNTTQYIKKGHAIIDYRFPHKSTCHVYERTNGTDTEIYTCTLNQTNIKENNNKFYIIQLLETDIFPKKYYLFTVYGRVGYKGTSKVREFGSNAHGISAFHDMFRTKTGNSWSNRKNFIKKSKKYFLCEMDLVEDTKKDTPKNNCTSQLDPRIQDVISLISDTKVMTNTMKSLDVDVKKMPLGKISKNQIKDGFVILKYLTDNLSTLSIDDINEKSSMFYTLIPYSCGMNTPPLIDSKALIQKHANMLKNLADIQIASSIIADSAKNDEHPFDQIYKKLNCKLIPIDKIKRKKAYELLKSYVMNTHAPTHSNYTLEVLDIFKVHRPNEAKRYDDFTENIHNKRLLWHGSRLSNWMGILSQGLRIFPTASVGSMFGRAIYLASSVSKSANYCFAKRDSPVGFLILCEAALGNMWEKLYAEFIRDLPKNYHSVWGKGKSTPNPKEFKVTKSGITIPCGHLINSDVRGSLLYDEHMVYDEKQVKISYLFKVKFNFK